jgi:DNA-binding CsgD family transcriptional regulator
MPGDQWPFERAQLGLDYAEWLRRRRRINDAKPVLTQALGTFPRLRARSWVQRAEAGLRACGVAVADTPGEPDALWELTPQQWQIVRLASDGLTNREIGNRLFLSPRTVSSHLYRSFPKLGVADRHQLRDVIARGEHACVGARKRQKRCSSLNLALNPYSPINPGRYQRPAWASAVTYRIPADILTAHDVVRLVSRSSARSGP